VREKGKGKRKRWSERKLGEWEKREELERQRFKHTRTRARARTHTHTCNTHTHTHTLQFLEYQAKGRCVKSSLLLRVKITHNIFRDDLLITNDGHKSTKKERRAKREKSGREREKRRLLWLVLVRQNFVSESKNFPKFQIRSAAHWQIAVWVIHSYFCCSGSV
jgi:hypothetical protein